MEKQVMEYASGNEMAAIAVKQIGYDVMVSAGVRRSRSIRPIWSGYSKPPRPCLRNSDGRNTPSRRGVPTCFPKRSWSC